MHARFTEAFQDGRQLIADSTSATVRCHRVAELVVPSGWIVACDPLVFPEHEPFATPIPPGRYPVIRSIAHVHHNGDERVACAMLQLAERVPVRWALATLPGQDVHSLGPEQIFGYPVDTGLGCFMDALVAQALERNLDEDPDYADTLIEEIYRTEVATWTWGNIDFDQADGANMVCFSSGFGDGFYASYFGYDAGDTPVCLVTDFGLIADAP